jgi:caffeoyl-CoA O-methyltransferase
MTTYNNALSDYVTQTFAAEEEVLKQIRQELPKRGLPAIMIRPEEAAFLRFLVAANQAKLAVEVGTLGGYSGIWLARALPQDGRLITLEINEERAQIARENFERAGVANKVELRLGDAKQILPELEEMGPFDLVFVDANKDGYPYYMDWAVANLRNGGIFAAHNAFAWGGKVIDENRQDSSVETMRQFHQSLADHPNLVATIFPAGQGMAVAVVRK